jgi:hypothetical protein
VPSFEPASNTAQLILEIGVAQSFEVLPNPACHFLERQPRAGQGDRLLRSGLRDRAGHDSCLSARAQRDFVGYELRVKGVEIYSLRRCLGYCVAACFLRHGEHGIAEQFFAQNRSFEQSQLIKRFGLLDGFDECIDVRRLDVRLPLLDIAACGCVLVSPAISKQLRAVRHFSIEGLGSSSGLAVAI